MKEMWNKRYAVDQFVYGKEPNQFFKDTLNELDSESNILFPAEGEGRNVVYAAKKGHSVLAFDISERAKFKALQLAKENNVEIDYLVGNLDDLNIKEESFDIAVLVSAHFSPDVRKALHIQIGKLVKPGGLIILEGFSEKHLDNRMQNPSVGGPDRTEMLFTKNMIKTDFDGFEVINLEEKEVKLHEGELHNGLGYVLRFIGRKLK